MMTARVFISGNSQAVRIPKQFQFTCDEVEIFKRGGELVFREKPKNLAKAFELLTSLPENFFAEGRGDLPPQDREGW